MTARDLRAVEDLDLFGAECADELEELEQDVIHRVTERRGAMLDDEDFGESAYDMLQGTDEAGAARFLFEAEIMKDPRVAQVSAAVVDDSAIAPLPTRRLVLEVTTNEGELLTPSVAIGDP